jgi:hypothetical protein
MSYNIDDLNETAQRYIKAGYNYKVRLVGDDGFELTEWFQTLGDAGEKARDLNLYIENHYYYGYYK